MVVARCVCDFVYRFGRSGKPPLGLVESETFRKASRTRKAVRSVLVSASGLKPGKYSGNIIATVSGADLFSEMVE